MIRLLAFISLVLAMGIAVVFHDRLNFGPASGADSVAHEELLSKEYVDKILHSTGQFDLNATKAIWSNHDVPFPGVELAKELSEKPKLVIKNTPAEKWIEVDLSTQTLFAHEGNTVAFSFPVSTGMPWTPTVTGEFVIWAKLLSQRMTGGSRADGSYYDLPNVPFVQYFHDGYGLHGAYWHNDFGHPRSHGCVNISVENSGKLYAWTNPIIPEGTTAMFSIPADQSTRVIVHGTTPTILY